MPKARTPGLPQINAEQGLYGSIPIELLPAGDAGKIQIPVWDGVSTMQWHLATVEGEGRIDIALDTDEPTITFIAADDRIYAVFTADAVFFKATSATFTADAVLA